MSFDDNHRFAKSELERILNACINKRLEEVDVKHVLASKKANKGYPGAVVEQSVLGYPADSARRPDLEVDGIETELKTTGIIKSKKIGIAYEAKEPVSVTAVRPKQIIYEEFETSGFWEKTAHILFVYYLYAHAVSSPAEYGDFPIKDYQFKDFEGIDKERLQHDWTTVRDFIRQIHSEFPNNPESQYPRISSDLNRQKLTVIDTAPKYPNPPRFRLKRRFVSALVNECFGAQYDKLSRAYSSFDEIDSECRILTQRYRGKTIDELFDIFGILAGPDPSKKDSERVIVRMFGGSAKHMRNVEVFTKFAMVGKSIVLTASGARTEDMKFSRVDFDELEDETMSFEESSFRANFSETQILCIVFEEPSHDAPFGSNKFIGFKRFIFDDAFIDQEVRPIWDAMRDLIVHKTLKLVPQLTADGRERYNPNGELRSAPNWPKSRNHNVFIRGTAADSDSKNKTVCINGVRMYPQNVWVKGLYMAQKLKDLPFL